MDKQRKPIDIRREKVLQRLEHQFITEKDLPKTTVDRIHKEMDSLIGYLSGKKKKIKRKKGVEQVAEQDRWYIDISRISYSKVRRTDRKKNKGKSRKKLRTVKSVTFVKTVVLQPGMLQNYREGRMGISPKDHTFRARKHQEESY